jgi:hypothetical protein
MTTTTGPQPATRPQPFPSTVTDPALPELRAIWGETGMRASANAGPRSVFAGPVRTPLGIAWRATPARGTVTRPTKDECADAVRVAAAALIQDYTGQVAELKDRLYR